MGMQDLVPTRLTSEQTGRFPTWEHQEDTWSRNDTSERRDNHKRDDLSKIFDIPNIQNQVAK